MDKKIKGKINKDISCSWFEDEDNYADIVINYLEDAIDLDEFYKQEIADVKYIINSDYDLTYSSSLLYINSRLYIDTHKCCVYWHGYDDLTYEKAISTTLKEKLDYLNELAKKDYDSMAQYHNNYLT